MRRLMGFVLGAAMLTAALAGCAGATATGGSFEEIDAAQLPSKVDLRNYDGKNYVTPVKCQNYGDCWAFGLAGAAEIAYLFANDMGVPAGEVNDKVDFSEKYIVWYVFHGMTEDDVTTGRVRASQVGEGFDLSKPESDNEIVSYFMGGVFAGHANLFGDGFGPVDESVSVKGEYPYAYDSSSSVEWCLPLNAEYRSAPTDAILRNSALLPSPAQKDADGSYTFNEDGLIAMKSELYKGHGVSVGVDTADAIVNTEHKTVYYNGEVTADHGVTVVGYDDDFPKEYFTNPNFKDSTPPGDGAFIIKNSWGVTEENAGDIDDGYMYLSYYDHSLMAPMSYTFDNRDAAQHPASNYDQYDLMMTEWYAVSEYENETKMANVFDAEEDESLYQIAYVTNQPKTEVTYEIYKDIEDGNSSSGTLLEKGVSRHTYGGYRRVDLKNLFALKKGERYAVVLTMRHMTGDDGGAVYTEVFPYSTPFFEGMSVRGIINPGESYLYTDGKWSDMSGMKDSLTERAYQHSVSEVDAKKKEMAPNAFAGKDTFTVDNYPIKAILVPAGK